MSKSVLSVVLVDFYGAIELALSNGSYSNIIIRGVKFSSFPIEWNDGVYHITTECSNQEEIFHKFKRNRFS